MKSRPWPVLIIAGLHVLSPIANIGLPAHMLKIPFLHYTSLLIKNESALSNFVTFLLFPLAGLSLYLMRRWSYGFFISAMALSLYLNFATWQAHPGLFPLWLLILAYTINLSLVSYFVIPAVRAPYFDPRLRWWETKPRFKVDWDCTIARGTGESTPISAVLMDLSEGGVLLRSDPLSSLDLTDSPLVLTFTFGQRTRQYRCKVVRLGVGFKNLYGAQFFELTTEQSRELRDLVRTLRQMGVPETQPRVPLQKDFKLWWEQVLSHPQSLLLPQIAQGTARSAQKPDQ